MFNNINKKINVVVCLKFKINYSYTLIILIILHKCINMNIGTFIRGLWYFNKKKLIKTTFLRTRIITIISVLFGKIIIYK